MSILRAIALCSAPNSDRFKMPLMRSTQMSLGSYWLWAGMLIAQANAESACSADQIAVRPHGFEFSGRVTDFDRADLRAGERDHLPELAGGNEFHCRCAEK